ncbi:polyketide cyclase [Paenibacillus frigoriresistens]|uniref:polyketide cyclase n=1 Tax=Paenibacillus alginolyticus TaxID=59839 RepID=UPI001563A224|nr:polyketide cyclase [Paenibacillus frigoriresistens]NRF92915.1 polyketide cyclase [Paenibacillus frigoriresistens]
MASYKYNFETNWKFESDIHQVWGLIAGFKYSDWWRGVSSERIYKGSRQDGIGDKYNYVFRTKLSYQLDFVAEIVGKEEPKYLEIKATGELEGRGVWKLSQEGNITHVQYVWQVNANKKWMNRLAPILRPAFVWNHDQVMDEGAKGIAAALGVKLLSY